MTSRGPNKEIAGPRFVFFCCFFFVFGLPAADDEVFFTTMSPAMPARIPPRRATFVVFQGFPSHFSFSEFFSPPPHTYKFFANSWSTIARIGYGVRTRRTRYGRYELPFKWSDIGLLKRKSHT